MKKHVLLLSVMALLIIATGAAFAAKPAPDTFTITGYTTSYEYGMLPNGRTWFHVLAQSSGATLEDDAFCTALLGMPCQATCQTFLAKDCGVTGYFTGQFTFEEWGEVDLNPVTGEGSGKGKNNGVVTIIAPDGTSVVQSNGKTDSQSVWGNSRSRRQRGRCGQLTAKVLRHPHGNCLRRKSLAE